MFDKIDPSEFLDNLFLNMGLSESLAWSLRTVIIVVVVALLSWLAYIVARFIIDRVVTAVVRRTKFKWDDIFLEAQVFTKLSHFAPALVIWFMADWALDAYPGWLDFVQKLTYIYMILASLLVSWAFIDAWHRIYNTTPDFTAQAY